MREARTKSVASIRGTHRGGMTKTVYHTGEGIKSPSGRAKRTILVMDC